MRALLVLIVLLLVPAAHACDRAGSTVFLVAHGETAESLETSLLRHTDIVVVGRVVRADPPRYTRRFENDAIAQIVVERRWKGPEVDTLTVTNGSGGDCVAGYEVGSRVMLYADSTVREDLSRGTPRMSSEWPERIRSTVDEQTARLDSAFASLVASGWNSRYRRLWYETEAHADSLIADARARGLTGQITGGVYEMGYTQMPVDLSEACFEVFLDGVLVPDAAVRVNTPTRNGSPVGGYEIGGLQPGRYRVRLTIPGYAPEETLERRVIQGDVSRNFAPERL